MYLNRNNCFQKAHVCEHIYASYCTFSITCAVFSGATIVRIEYIHPVPVVHGPNQVSPPTAVAMSRYGF